MDLAQVSCWKGLLHVLAISLTSSAHRVPTASTRRSHTVNSSDSCRTGVRSTQVTCQQGWSGILTGLQYGPGSHFRSSLYGTPSALLLRCSGGVLESRKSQIGRGPYMWSLCGLVCLFL